MPQKRRSASRSTSTARDEAAAARFVERFAGALIDAGMPRMPARVFALLLSTDDGARTAAQLADQLQVSPAAVSGAVRYLVQVGMVARDREPGERYDTYRLYSDMWYEMFAKREQLYQRWIDTLRAGVEAVGASTPAGDRLDESARFLDFLRVEMPVLIEQWHSEQSAAAPRRRTAR
jgi:DNA-binding transcriptional regulator GbsR (MarR family)